MTCAGGGEASIVCLETREGLVDVGVVGRAEFTTILGLGDFAPF